MSTKGCPDGPCVTQESSTATVAVLGTDQKRRSRRGRLNGAEVMRGRDPQWLFPGLPVCGPKSSISLPGINREKKNPTSAVQSLPMLTLHLNATHLQFGVGGWA